MTRPGHYLELDGLRGVAAVAVALFHEQAVFGGFGFFGHGYLAVDFFYMLSGFVLQHAYGERLRARGSVAPFLRDRAIRLYPMLAVGALLGLIATTLAESPGAGSVAAAAVNALGLPALWSAYPFRINSPTWSLFFELLANVAFALPVPLLTPRRLRAAVLVSALAMLALDAHFGLFGFGWLRTTLAAGVVRVAASFAIGVWLYHLHRAGVLAGGGRRWWVAPALVASLAAVPTYAPASAIYDPVVVFGLFPLLILAAAGSRPVIAALARASGAVSYPFYIVHEPVLKLLLLAGAAAGMAVSRAIVLALIAATLAIAGLILRLYDEPVRSALRARFGSRRHRGPATA